MSRKIEKCRSSETKWSALDAKAQSAYLLSSGSLCIRFHSKYTDCNVQLSSERRSLTTLSATEGDVFSANFSWYSSRIFVLRIKSNLPVLNASKMGRYGDETGSAISRTLISRTTLIEPYRYANAPFSIVRWSGHSSFSPATTGSFHDQSFERNSQPVTDGYPSVLPPKQYTDTVLATPVGGCSTYRVSVANLPSHKFFLQI